MLHEEAGCAQAVYDIVQRFISDIGIPTIGRYEKCANILWKLPRAVQCPPPLSQHGILPKAWPPNSSSFVYHGQKPVIILDDDEVDEILSSTQLQLISCVENEGFLKARIGDLETELADSRQREQDLLVKINDMFQIKHLTNAGAAPATSHNLPHTPNRNRHRTPHFSQRSPQVQVHSPLPKNFSPAPTATTEYGMFIEFHNLDDIFPAIDLVRRKVAMYLWQEELRNTGVPEDLLPQLMAVMSSHPNPSSSSPFV